MDLGQQSHSPDSRSSALSCSGPGKKGDREKGAKCHLFVLSGDDRQSQGGYPFPSQHCQQLLLPREAPENGPEGERMLVWDYWNPAWVGVGLAGLPCWLKEVASRASGSCVDPASCFHLQTPEKSRLVLPNPLYHCLGSVGGAMMSVMHGATLIVSFPTFDGKKALEAISRERWASVGSYPQAHETLLFLPPGP